MLLFLKDWNRYPTARPDIDTVNKSYVRLALLFRSLGVKNHAFILALVNQSLKGIDPHSLGLTEAQKSAIAVECLINPWYYFREIARAPAVGGGKEVMQEANRGNIALYWLFFNHVMCFLIQIRQTGKSFSTDSLMTYLMNVACNDTEINLLTKDDTLRKANIIRLKDIAATLPGYLNQRTKADANNFEEITVHRRKNRYKSHVAQSSKAGALKLGRGLTSGIFHIDEAPFQHHIKTAMGAALGASGAAVDRARENNAHYGTIITTTAGKKDDPNGAHIYQLLSTSAVWSEKFLDAADQASLYEIIRKASHGRALRVNITLNHRQIGKTDDWLLEKLEASTQTGDDANRDYFNMWTSGGLSSPLSTTILGKIRNSVVGANFTEISAINSYTLRWYIDESDIDARMKSSTFVLSMDSSNASGGDDCGFHLMDTQTLETIAAANINETNLIHLSRWVSDFLITHPTVTFIPENKSSGQGIIDYLLINLAAAGINPFKRIYNTVVDEKQTNREQFEEVSRLAERGLVEQYDRFKKTFGFTTTGTGKFARSVLYSDSLQLAAKRSCDRVYDKTLADQITGLIVKNGRVNHPVGEHDDMCIAWLLNHWLITKGKNLSYYGIDPSLVGSLVHASGSDSDPQHRAEQIEQRTIRTSLKTLAERLANARDGFLVTRLEQEIRQLSRKVILEENELFNIDSLIKEAKEKKRLDRANGGISNQSVNRFRQGSSWDGSTNGGTQIGRFR